MPPRGLFITIPMKVRVDYLDLIGEYTVPIVEVPPVVIHPPVTTPDLPTTSPPPTTTPQWKTHDIIGMLPTEVANSIGSQAKDSVTFHWEGAAAIPNMSVDGHVIFLQAIARFHIRKNWAASGVVNGDGIMYHEAIGQNGDVYLMRNPNDILYHAGNDMGNKRSRAILVVCSKDTPPNVVQLEAVGKRAAYWKGVIGSNSLAYPHSSWSATECPGDTIRWKLGY